MKFPMWILSAILAALWLNGLIDTLDSNDLILKYLGASLVMVAIVAAVKAIRRALCGVAK